MMTITMTEKQRFSQIEMKSDMSEVKNTLGLILQKLDK